MKNRWYLFFVLFVLLSACNKQHQGSLDLKSLNWSLKSLSEPVFLDSVAPDDVHLALISKGVIPDPFFRDNEKKVQWVGQSPWVFETEFDVPSSMLSQQQVDLVFEGLDTYSQIKLNDSLIAETDNMFRWWRIPVKGLLKQTNNKLAVTFFPPEEINKQKKNQFGIPIPEIRGFTRKAPYQFGWDWGPKLVTMGIWKPARIEAGSLFELSDVFVDQQFVTDSVAKLRVVSTIVSRQSTEVKLEILIDGTEVATTSVDLVVGENILITPVVLHDFPLWYPNGMGEAALINVQVKLIHDELIEEKVLNIGLRNIELVRKDDAVGSTFLFNVNGREVYIKGANYIPQDNFLSRVTREQTRDLLVMAQKSNMNMLRVWGGGVYETDDFYSLCDSLGLMVWQDFMFAGTVYPGDSAFLANVSAEAVQQVTRLRNHPSIALWCGNNEVDEAWHNWGWQKSLGYSAADSTQLWNAYQSLFEELLPLTVERLSPHTDYVSSSPNNGWGRKVAYAEGDVHYWGVWWGGEPFEQYNSHVGRFVSEYGFQGMPDLSTINSFTIPSDRAVDSEVMAVHQKHPRGKDLIEVYMARDFCVPDSFEDYVYVSQLLQAFGIKTAIEAHRTNKPYNMGTLYWQLNDCWPVVSWSGIDYQHRWKAMQYAVKKAYDPFLITTYENDSGLFINVISDCSFDRSPTVFWQLLTFDGDTLEQGFRKINLPAGGVFRLHVDGLNAWIQNSEFKQEIVLKMSLIDNQQILASGLYYFAKPKDLFLDPDPRITLKVDTDMKAAQITITSQKLAKGVCLSSENEGWFSNNYFDIPAGDTIQVNFFTTEDELVKNKFRVARVYNSVCR